MRFSDLPVLMICLLMPFGINGRESNFVDMRFIRIQKTHGTFPVIPWTGDEMTLLQSPPLFELEQDETRAKGWIAVHSQGFIVCVSVIDNLHLNTQQDAAIWDGDAIQLGIDANGSGVGSRDPGSAFVGPDDASITFALTEKGPRAWAHYQGNPSLRGSIQNMDMDISRNEEEQETRYSLYFSWSNFQMKPGIPEIMGFAVQVNDTDRGPKQLRLKWGDGAGGNLRPGLFKKVRIAKPDEEFVSILPYKTNIWNINDVMRIQIAAYISDSCQLCIRNSAGILRSFIINPDTSGVQRYLLSIKPTALYSREGYLIDAQSSSYTMEREEFIPAYPGVTIEDLLAELEQKLAGNADSLAARHFQAVYDIVVSEWQLAQSRLGESEYEALLCTEYSDYLLREVKNQLNAGQDVSSGRKPMLCTFRASDNRLQFYKLLLPHGWNPDRGYPVIVDLHGAGHPYPLSFISSSTGSVRGTEEMAENHVRAFILQPWCRGNAGYRGAAGRDIYDALDDVKSHWNTADSVYLTGFSMGGYGAWAHMIQSPETWRAVVIAAGGPSYPAEKKQLDALGDMPVMIWHGDKDGAVSVENAYKMQEKLESAGLEPVMKIIPDRGHLILASERVGIYRWLLAH